MICRYFLMVSVLTLLIACSKSRALDLSLLSLGGATLQRIELETVSLEGRLVVIEVERPPTLGPASQKDSELLRYDRYLFWDYCRLHPPIWQFVQFDRALSDKDRWLYKVTRQKIDRSGAHKGSPRTKQFSQTGFRLYSDLKSQALSLFEPGKIQCEIEPFDQKASEDDDAY